MISSSAARRLGARFILSALAGGGVPLLAACSGSESSPADKVLTADAAPDQDAHVTPDAGCSNGLTDCSGACVDLQTSHDHCGKCRNVCGSKEVCSKGVCSGSCPSNTTLCLGGCVDTSSNPSHCGACGKACAAGEFCTQGTCASQCPGGTTACGSDCVDLSSDPNHCGVCGGHCDEGYACMQGACKLACTGTDCGGLCTNTKLDPAHCGGCGQACSTGQVCSAGSCVDSCGPGMATCSGGCTDTSVDSGNCGGCGIACPAGTVCSNGTCNVTCGPGTMQCNGSCVDTATNPKHCGQCDNICPPSEICLQGDCSPCTPDKTFCGGVCVSTLSNPQHCGGCGIACPNPWNGYTGCVAGVCSAKCDNGFATCPGDSVECYTRLYDDEANCGGCGNKCGVDELCTSGKCAPCSPGETSCNGYCVDTSNNTGNCGGCGVSCPWGNFSQIRECKAGVCELNCYPGYMDCDGTAANGCEADLADDPKNCGTCGVECGLSQLCSQGVCTGCTAGKTYCGGYSSCVSLLTDNSNCGACGVACVTSVSHGSGFCQAGTCALACTSGYFDCDMNALNGCEAAVSAANCGGCGIACAAAQYCSKASQCTACAPPALEGPLPLAATGTTIGSADRVNTACGSGNAPDIFYSFTAPSSKTYVFDTLGSTFDTVLEVRKDSCDGASLGCNDNDNPSGSTSKVSVALAAGQMVIIVIDGKQLTQGAYTLHVN